MTSSAPPASPTTPPADPVVAVWDHRLHGGAVAEGLAAAPSALPADSQGRPMPGPLPHEVVAVLFCSAIPACAGLVPSP